MILERVDAVVEAVGQLEVALGDVVHEVVGDHARRLHVPGAVQLLRGGAVERAVGVGALARSLAELR